MNIYITTKQNRRHEPEQRICETEQEAHFRELEEEDHRLFQDFQADLFHVEHRGIIEICSKKKK